MARMLTLWCLQATWAFVRAAVPLLKQVVGGRVELASQQVAPQLCCALARLCGQTTQGGRAFAAHVFKECENPRSPAAPVPVLSMPHPEGAFVQCEGRCAPACTRASLSL